MNGLPTIGKKVESWPDVVIGYAKVTVVGDQSGEDVDLVTLPAAVAKAPSGRLRVFGLNGRGAATHYIEKYHGKILDEEETLEQFPWLEVAR
jgi:hypothetical protein